MILSTPGMAINFDNCGYFSKEEAAAGGPPPINYSASYFADGGSASLSIGISDFKKYHDNVDAMFDDFRDFVNGMMTTIEQMQKENKK